MSLSFSFFLHISVHRGGAVTTWSTFEPGLRNIFRARGRKKIRPCVGGRRPGDDCMAGGWKEDEEQQQQQDASIFLIDDRVANSIIISSPVHEPTGGGIGNITLLTCGSLTLIPCHKHLCRLLNDSFVTNFAYFVFFLKIANLIVALNCIFKKRYFLSSNCIGCIRGPFSVANASKYQPKIRMTDTKSEDGI